jgi:hypothetical protein
MKTIITHFYNEEYLLPLWLEHHKKYFDFGVLIDYGSTDRSVEICKEICPHWQVLPSKNQYFDAKECDVEVEFYERQLSGWRIALTVTEFLVGDVNKLMQDSSDKIQWRIPCIVFAGYDPNGYIDTTKPLWHQIKMGLPYTSRPEQAWPCRSLHNFNDIQYTPGRHFYPNNTEDAMIFKYSSCLIGKPMIDRRLQIQHRVPDSDRKAGIAEHHVYTKGGGLTLETLPMFYEENVGSKNPIDCTEFMQKLNLITKPATQHITSTIVNYLPGIEYKTYLELGIGNGLNFKAIDCATKMSVDITPDISVFTGTTDDYFSKLKDTTKFDIIFIDANHDIDYALRDFNNAIDHANEWILLDDTMPKEEYLTQSVFCSDSYKLLYYLLKYTNFEVYPVNYREGLTLVKLPATKVELNDDAKNLSWHEFMRYLTTIKIYSVSEMELLLQNS